MILPFFLKSKNNHWQENWVEIHRTDDNWKVELIKNLLSRNEIVCRPDHGSQIRIYVEPNDEEWTEWVEDCADEMVRLKHLTRSIFSGRIWRKLLRNSIKNFFVSCIFYVKYL